MFELKAYLASRGDNGEKKLVTFNMLPLVITVKIMDLLFLVAKNSRINIFKCKHEENMYPK